MYIYKSCEIFCENAAVGGDRDIAEKYPCPICGKSELKYENVIPAVYISPEPKDFMYCHGCRRWIAVI